MTTMSKVLYLTLITLLITGCATSNLSYKNEQVNIRIDKTSLNMRGMPLEKKNENFSTLFLKQNLLRLDDGSLVVFEEADTDLQYRFEPTTPRSIKVIFNAKRVIKVHYNTFIYAFQVVLKNNKVLNVLAAQGFDQELQMVYGMSTERLNDMLRKLGQDAKPAYYKNVIDLRHERSPYLSQWDVQKVHIVPLVVPIGRLGRL